MEIVRDRQGGRDRYKRGLSRAVSRADHGAVHIFESDDGAWLMEFAGDLDLKSLVCEARDSEADEIACDVLDLLHANSTLAPVGLRTLQQNFRALFEAETSDLSTEIFRAGANEARDLLSAAGEVVVLHGDVHHKNILFGPSRGWLAIDPLGLIGEGTYDVANLFFNPDETERDIFETTQGFSRKSSADGVCLRMFKLRVEHRRRKTIEKTTENFTNGFRIVAKTTISCLNLRTPNVQLNKFSTTFVSERYVPTELAGRGSSKVEVTSVLLPSAAFSVKIKAVS